MKSRFCLIAAVLLLTASTARAQGGCVDSPECPTPILAMVGAAGLLAARCFKRKF